MPQPEADDRHLARARLAALRESGVRTVGEADAREILSVWGLPFGPGWVLSDDNDVDRALAHLNLPFVLKVDAEGYPHKTEHGLVILDCRTRDDVLRAYEQLMYRVGALELREGSYKILVEEMIGGDSEWILGVRNEASLGTAVVFGAGGIYTEVLDDVAVGMYPLDAQAVDLMIEGLRMSRLLFGYRGQRGVSKETLVLTLQAAATFGYECREIVSGVDINPVIVGGERTELVAVDALITLSDPSHRDVEQNGGTLHE